MFIFDLESNKIFHLNKFIHVYVQIDGKCYLEFLMVLLRERFSGDGDDSSIATLLIASLAAVILGLVDRLGVVTDSTVRSSSVFGVE